MHAFLLHFRRAIPHATTDSSPLLDVFPPPVPDAQDGAEDSLSYWGVGWRRGVGKGAGVYGGVRAPVVWDWEVRMRRERENVVVDGEVDEGSLD